MHGEDSQLLKHHSCTAAEDTARKSASALDSPAPAETTDTPYCARAREGEKEDGVKKEMGIGCEKIRERRK